MEEGKWREMFCLEGIRMLVKMKMFCFEDADGKEDTDTEGRRVAIDLMSLMKAPENSFRGKK